MSEKLEQVLTVRVPAELYEQMKKLGVKLERKPAWIARKAIAEYMEKQHAAPVDPAA